jgi:arginyl-tRNA synthetase
MIPADIGAEIARLLRAGVAAGDTSRSVGKLSAAGTWRPAPPHAGGGSGTYATSLPLEISGLAGRAAGPVAARLAAGLGAVAWIRSARVTGDGYLTVSVTAGHLAELPARIVAAGPASARSGALAGVRATAPSLPDLGAAPGWERAWRMQRDALVGRLADAAGATVMFARSQRNAPSDSAARPAAGAVSASTVSASTVSASTLPAALAHYGADAVRYALARASAPQPAAIIRQLGLPLDLANPFVLVRYAHADAASTLRWAAELGLAPPDRPARSTADELFPPELALIDAMSWLPERVAAAARSARPAELTACVEHLAGAWLDCSDHCPALPFRGRAAPSNPRGLQAAARLGLASAARTALEACLALLGLAAPARM